MLKMWSQRIQSLLILLLWIIVFCGWWGDNWLYLLIDTSLDMDLNLHENSAQECLMIVDKIIVGRWNFYQSVKGSLVLPGITHLNLTKPGSLEQLQKMINNPNSGRLWEQEQLLTNIEFLQHLKNIYPEFNKYFFCHISSHQWGKKSDADAVLFDSITKDFVKFQFKFIWGDLNSKWPSDYNKYQLTTDVLDITLAHNNCYSELINKFQTHVWMMEVWFQTHSPIFDENVLKQGLKSHHDYLCVNKDTNYKDIGKLCKANFDGNIKTHVNYSNWKILEALKEVKQARCSPSEFITPNICYPSDN